MSLIRFSLEDGYANSSVLGWRRSCLETLYYTGRLVEYYATEKLAKIASGLQRSECMQLVQMSSWCGQGPFWGWELERIKRQNNYFQLYEDLTHLFCPLFSVKGKVEVRNGYFWSGDSQVVAKMLCFLWTAPLLLYRTCGFSNWHNRCWSKCKPKCSHFGQENPISIEFWNKSLWEQS